MAVRKSRVPVNNRTWLGHHGDSPMGAQESERDAGRSGCRGELLQGHRGSVLGLAVDVVEESAG